MNIKIYKSWKLEDIPIGLFIRDFNDFTVSIYLTVFDSRHSNLWIEAIYSHQLSQPTTFITICIININSNADKLTATLNFELQM